MPSVASSDAEAVVTALPPAQAHLDYLDGLRALAALFVLFCHALQSPWPYIYSRYPPPALHLFTGWLYHGHFAVDVFIVLSGFCLMLPVVRGDGTLRGGAKRFFRRRARRILPTYYGALAFSLILSL